MKVLLVDDSRASRWFFVRILGCVGIGEDEIVQAADGLEAWTHLKGSAERGSFTLMITDLHMPGLDGEQLLLRMNDLPNRPLVVVVTSERREEPLKRIRSLGADGILSKPFTPEQFRDLIQSIGIPVHETCSRGNQEEEIRDEERF